MIDYDEMSDFEINKRVVMYLPLAINEDQLISKRPTESAVMVNDLVNSYWVDFCNNAVDMMPIIIDHEISIEFMDGGLVNIWIDTERSTYSPARLTKKSELPRSAAICFLKMKAAE